LIDRQHRCQAAPSLGTIHQRRAVVAQGADEISKDGDVPGGRDTSGVATSTGSAAFLAPEIRTWPSSLVPPVMESLSI